MAKQIIPANSVKFEELCIVLEQIVKKKSKPDKEKVLHNFVTDFKLKSANIIEEKNSTFFPILRLLAPSLDRERAAYNLKESKLGALLIKVLSIKKDSNDGRKLLNFRSVNTTHEGDFASVAYFVFKNRMSLTSSTLTIGDINEVLDKIASLEAGNKGQMLDELFSYVIRNLTANNLKWFLRIVIKDLKLRLGTTRILCCYHPDAPEQITCNTLSKICEELKDGNVRPLEMGVKMFHAVSPMLSERFDIMNLAQLPTGRTYQIEEKFDGERFQIHMENGKFEYFSRNGHLFTSTYGQTHESGLLTPHLRNCFSVAVESFILDGEMMGWHKVNQCFGSKGMAFDIKKITERSSFRPCFCAFDVLYYNGRCLVGPSEKGGLPLKERLNILDKILTEVPGVIQRSERKIVKQSSDILDALNKAIESREEGIVVKDTESYYIPNKRNAGWYKIKPEYTEGATEDLDLVIIGADDAENKRQGRAKSFLVACADSVGDGAAPHRWLCLGRVSTGLSHEEHEKVCSHLERNWKRTRHEAPPPTLVLNKIKPDMWILPEHSIVLEVRATELTRCTDFATSHTLRFPRVVRIREDKPVKDILKLDEFNKLVENKGSVIKMATKSINEEQIGEGTLKTRKKRPSKVLQVAADFKRIKHDDVTATSNALKDRKICVLSDDEDCSREELARIIQMHGGKFVANDGPDTWCCVVGRITYRARVIIESGEADVTTTSWLRSLPASEEHCTIAPLDMLSMKRDTRINFARQYDKFGDSYTEELDEDILKRCFQKMDDEPQVYLTKQEMLNLDKELFEDCNPHSFLRQCVIHIPKECSLLAIQAKMCGAKLCDATASDITHIVTNDPNVARNGLVVSEQWLEKCISEKKFIDEADFIL